MIMKSSPSEGIYRCLRFPVLKGQLMRLQFSLMKIRIISRSRTGSKKLTICWLEIMTWQTKMLLAVIFWETLKSLLQTQFWWKTRVTRCPDLPCNSTWRILWAPLRSITTILFRLDKKVWTRPPSSVPNRPSSRHTTKTDSQDSRDCPRLRKKVINYKRKIRMQKKLTVATKSRKVVVAQLSANESYWVLKEWKVMIQGIELVDDVKKRGGYNDDVIEQKWS